MSVASRVQQHLQQHSVFYDVRSHAYCASSERKAHVAGVPANKLAKAVLAEDSNGNQVLAVIPADRRLSLFHLSAALQRTFHLADETTVDQTFFDCAYGAAPPIGAAYQLETVVDDALLRQDEVYFEAGDHHQLVHLSGKQFRHLLADAQHGYFSVSRQFELAFDN